MAPPPLVTGISPKEGPPGTKVTIRGEFLGTTATDFIGLQICGCDCLLSAEWKSKNKIVARSGPCKGRGDIIVTTKSGGVGSSTVQFRGYHESIGPVKESAVWVEEVAPPSLPWGRRPMSPTSYTPPDPLGLSTEGDEGKFPEEDLHELFPDGSGKLSDENFQPGWYLLEHHSNTSFEDLRAGMAFLQRKVESQKEGQLSFLKANTGAVMDQLDRLVLLKNMFEEDQRKNGKEPLPGLQAAIEESITLADTLFSDILSRKENADKTREAFTMLTRHKFLFQLPSSIDKNIKKKEYDLVVNDYTRVKNLSGTTDVKLFQRILDEIDKKIEDLKQNLYVRVTTMPINVQEQTKYIRLLISLSWEGDAAWAAITARQAHLIDLLNKVKDHFRLKEEQETADSKRKSRSPTAGYSQGNSSAAWCGAASAALAGELKALWPLARRYFAGDLAGLPDQPEKHKELKEMITSAVELFAGHMRTCLIGSKDTPRDDVSVTSRDGIVTSRDASTAAETRADARLAANLRHLREAYDTLIKLDLPSQPLSIVEKVIFEYRVHGMTAFLLRALKRVQSLQDVETWKIEQFTDYGAVTNLPHLLETYMTEALSSIHKSVFHSSRRETELLSSTGEPAALLQKHTQAILLAYVTCLQELALQYADQQDFNNTNLSVALCQRAEEGGVSSGWQQRLLVNAANAHYSRRVTLANIQKAFVIHEFPIPTPAFQAANKALLSLEGNIAELYLEHKGDPLVGTIEPSRCLGSHNTDAEVTVEDARPYVYEIINNLIAVHAEVDSVCGSTSTRYLRDICETVCEELARLSSAPKTRAAALQTRAEIALLRLACAEHLTSKAESYLTEALSLVPPLENNEEKLQLEKLVKGFKKRMELQLASLNCNMETV